MRKNIIILAILSIISVELNAQKLIPFKLPDTGVNVIYSTTKADDGGYIINPMSFTDNGDGTITDNITGLMWQKNDGGEMTFENAQTYCENLTLGGYSDWRLPTGTELFGINNYSYANPALNTTVFTKTEAEYWWSSQQQTGDNTKIWVVNAGGGIGNHSKTETVSAGGTKKFHIRAVRNIYGTSFNVSRFTDIGNGTIKDNYTGLIWEKLQSASTYSWDQALEYAKSLRLDGKSDWRLPNIKELQSLNDMTISKPSLNKTYFPNALNGSYWSSTTLLSQQPTKAWDMNVEFGVVSYNEKTKAEYVICVRGGTDNTNLNIKEALIPEGTFNMGDHFGFVDPSHPSDELPLHDVSVDSFYIAKTETTNDQYIAFLNDQLIQGLVEVRNNIVYAKGDTIIYCYTNAFAPYYSIAYNGKEFYSADFRIYHPVVGIMWYGAAAFCNWLSNNNAFDKCYNLKTGACDFTKNGYRLPTEAEWEYAARGSNNNPYYNYPWGDDQDVTKANWPDSKDPYEGKSESEYPFTTPVGFYDGSLHLKTDYNWKSTMQSYQTANGANNFGLYDVAGNVWELINDWYGQNYYKLCVDNNLTDNPKGPESGFIMPDGKPYRGMRGGNWYNGYNITGGSVNDGHSRVSNRNPSYYRGPQDPNHPWYHIGFRVARNYEAAKLDVGEEINSDDFELRVSPNPCTNISNVKFMLKKDSEIELSLYDAFGTEVLQLSSGNLQPGNYQFILNTKELTSGVYYLQIDNKFSKSLVKVIVIK